MNEYWKVMLPALVFMWIMIGLAVIILLTGGK